MTTVLSWIVIGIFVLLSVLLFLIPGYSFSGFVCLGVAGVVLCYYLLGLLASNSMMAAKVLRTILSTLLCIGILAAALTFAVIHRASLGDETGKSEYLVVLGAGVRGTTPSTILQSRIDAATQYLQKNPDVICIVSGGQGEGEDISEAQCMYDHITAAGIDGSRIWLEDRSTSTGENFRFTLELIEEKTGETPDHLAVLSNEFHLYRASMIAENCGITISGVPANTPWLSLRINYTMREIVAVWYYMILGGN